jgi:hypothetical protein
MADLAWIQETYLHDTITDILSHSCRGRYRVLDSKQDVSQEVVAAVDWDSIGFTMRNVPQGRRVFVTKQTPGMCGVG